MQDVPRNWLREPLAFGRTMGAALRPADDAFQAADRRASQIQSDLVVSLRARMRARRPHITFKQLAASSEFPYSYDTLSKCTRGQQWMSVRVYAAVLNALDAEGLHA